MVGHNVLLVAKEDGHSPHTMLTSYAAWTEGATETDVEAIRRALERSRERMFREHSSPRRAPAVPRICHWIATRTRAGRNPPSVGPPEPAEDQAFRLAKDGGADGTRTRDPRRDRPVF